MSINKIVKKEWENFAKIKEELKTGGFSIDEKWSIQQPAISIWSPSEHIFVGEVRPKNRSFEREDPPSLTEPVEIFLHYNLDLETIQNYQKMTEFSSLLEFRDFLDSKKIPYTENPPRYKTIKHLKNKIIDFLGTSLEYIKRVQGEKKYY